MSLAPNAVQACPSRARRVHHAAHGEVCLTCTPDMEWAARCPAHPHLAPVKGRVVQSHPYRRGSCPGVGETVKPPELVDQRIWVPGMPRHGVVRVQPSRPVLTSVGGGMPC
jgi:hypothetical protein